MFSAERYSIRYINIREKMTGFAWISLLKGIDTSSQHENIGEILKSRRPSPFLHKG